MANTAADSSYFSWNFDRNDPSLFSSFVMDALVSAPRAAATYFKGIIHEIEMKMETIQRLTREDPAAKKGAVNYMWCDDGAKKEEGAAGYNGTNVEMRDVGYKSMVEINNNNEVDDDAGWCVVAEEKKETSDVDNTNVRNVSGNDTNNDRNDGLARCDAKDIDAWFNVPVRRPKKEDIVANYIWRAGKETMNKKRGENANGVWRNGTKKKQVIVTRSKKAISAHFVCKGISDNDDAAVRNRPECMIFLDERQKERRKMERSKSGKQAIFLNSKQKEWRKTKQFGSNKQAVFFDGRQKEQRKARRSRTSDITQ